MTLLPAKIYSCLMRQCHRQKKTLMGNFSQFNLLSLLITDADVERKKQAKGKNHPLPLQRLSSRCRLRWLPLARRWVVQEVGLVHGGIFVLVFLQLSSCITENNV